MHITLLTAGAAADTAPYAALALGLRAAGFGVRLAGAGAFAPIARAYGLDYAEIDEATGTVQAEAVQVEAWWACQEADAVIYDPLTLVNGYFLAQRRGVPAVAAALAPFAPTRANTAWLLSAGLRLGAANNLLTHALAQRAARGPVQQFWRQRAGTAPPSAFAWRASEQLPVVYGFSAHVLPRPAGWPAHLHITGDWPLPAPDGWRPAPELLAFVRAGPAPVGVALPARLTVLAVEALEQAGCRGVVIDDGSLPGGLALPSGVIRVDNVPQVWLYPRLAALVYAGGAGQAAAALRAGIPSLVVPTGREGAWERLLAARGLARVARRGASPAQLADHLRAALSDAAQHRRLAALSDALAAEDGVSRAVAIIAEAVR